MLAPNRTKYRKQQRGSLKGNAYAGSKVSFGEYGIIALEKGWITDRQIESARVAINRFLQRGARVWIMIFPDKPHTRKGEGVRMGKGKGAPDGWTAPVKPGRVMFEVSGVSEEKAKEAFRRASHKLPIKVKFVKNLDLEG